MKLCKKCKGFGKDGTHPILSFNCLPCQGKGLMSLEMLQCLRIGRQIRRLRLRYQLSSTRCSRMFKMAAGQWERMEYGHYEADYTKTMLKWLHDYVKEFEILKSWLLLKTKHGKKSVDIEIMSRFEEQLVKDAKADMEKEFPQDTFVIIPQQVVVERF